ncbi:hypothetical protein [Streptomyces sp. CB02959]|uniref:hypothetical protein n=1 Tax=Streptomyces sp. CB02959 TaxID=2020330 RepID=UPI000C26DEB6|nr:hypothetical protein [Streptomyces sp. CB02959]PJN39204.1 hypothetical protein CG747_19665 [Streptomyces sp. CB02959]
MDPASDRQALAEAVRAALERDCPGSRTLLLGSLAAGTADDYSDIDIEWVVPDRAFAVCLARAEGVLGRVQPVAEVRCDPDFRHSDRRRLLFVRFARLPLFWRLDLSVRTESVADHPDYDRDNPRARARDDEWSRPASALANAVGAVKALARHRPEEARGLLDRGFARIGEPHEAPEAGERDGPGGLRRGGAAEVARLARAAARREPELAPLAEQVVRLADEYGPGDRR